MADAPDLSVARSSLDFGAYGALRAKAQRDQGGALQETAQQFEAMFLQMIMKSMRATVEKSDLFSSQSMDTYEAMYDRELATVLARRGGIGLADVLTEQLERPGAPALTTAAALELRPEVPARSLSRTLSAKRLPDAVPPPLPLKGRIAP